MALPTVNIGDETLASDHNNVVNTVNGHDTTITSHTTELASHASTLTSHTSTLSTHTSEISTNTSNISTNTSNISTNTSNISTLQGSPTFTGSPTVNGDFDVLGVLQHSSITVLDAHGGTDVTINAPNAGGGHLVRFTVGGVIVAHIDGSGNLILKGALTQNGSP